MSFGDTEIVRRCDSGAPLVHQSQEKERERERSVIKYKGLSWISRNLFIGIYILSDSLLDLDPSPYNNAHG